MLRTNCGHQGAPQGQALLVHYGPEIRVHVGYDHAWQPQSNAAPIAGTMDLLALIDTGARQSCIDSALAARLELPHFDRRPVSTCNGKVLVDFYLAQVHVPALRFTQRGPFAGVPLVASGFKNQVLLGRTFLSYLRMEYDGPSGQVVLLFE